MLPHRLEEKAVIYTHILKFPIKSIIPYKSFTKCLSHLGLLLLFQTLWWVGGCTPALYTHSHACAHALTSR